jgi:hypothetical protein
MLTAKTNRLTKEYQMSENTELRKAVYACRQLPTEANKAELERIRAEFVEKFGEPTTAFIVKDANRIVDEAQKALLKKAMG